MTRLIDHAGLALTGLVTVPALAHVLELPGKMRLSESEYRATQRIYYPGFTVVGVAEFAAPLLVFASLCSMPKGDPRRPPTFVALGGLLGVQLIFWGVTQPINRVWVKGAPLHRASSRFFGTDKPAPDGRRSWTHLRNRWEASHVVRAALAVTSLAALWIAAGK